MKTDYNDIMKDQSESQQILTMSLHLLICSKFREAQRQGVYGKFRRNFFTEFPASFYECETSIQFAEAFERQLHKYRALESRAFVTAVFTHVSRMPWKDVVLTRCNAIRSYPMDRSFDPLRVMKLLFEILEKVELPQGLTVMKIKKGETWGGVSEV